MIITIEPKLEAQLRRRAEARQVAVDIYVQQILERDIRQADADLDQSHVPASLVRRGSLLMVAGELPADFDVVRAIDKDRAKRGRGGCEIAFDNRRVDPVRDNPC